MIPPEPEFVHPTEQELVAAGQTLSFLQTPRDPVGVRDRLAAASALLRALEKPPSVASLVFVRNRNSPVEVAAVGAGIVVGRGSEATICLNQIADLSRRHFGIRPEAGAWLLEDFGSRNGTTVDGVEGRITRRLLRDGDIIFAGDLLFLFVDPKD